MEFSPRLTPVRRVAATALLALAGLLLESCGGGAGSSPAPAGAPVQAATFRYPAPPVYVVGTAIAPLTPEVTGGLYGFVVIPYLPPGPPMRREHSFNFPWRAIGGSSGPPAAPTSPLRRVAPASAHPRQDSQRLERP
jgi:hypothetical protein